MARRHGLRFMVRLVKGAYWDGEIKRAQELGLPALPGVHPQAPHRRVLPGLRAGAAGVTTR
jgi:RHH-type proline utilization regulon transcriptional repressor/proline dehydrogenase/delta 1-pyrroline-5-carboxylate dehydrogenase